MNFNRKFLVSSAVVAASLIGCAVKMIAQKPDGSSGASTDLIPSIEKSWLQGDPIKKTEAGLLIQDLIRKNKLPADIDGEFRGNKSKYKMTYTLDPVIQEHADKLLKSFRPDYASVVVMDAKTGRVLAMSNFVKGQDDVENLTLKSTFPAASLFKIVTASAAVDMNLLNPNDAISFNGANHTLYKSNVFDTRLTRWTRSISIKEAFAKSINTVFAKIGINYLSPKNVRDYSNRFQFDQTIDSDLPMELSTTQVPDLRSFQVAEITSGFNRISRISPMHGALLASAIANEGSMQAPFIIDSIQNSDGANVYQAKPQELSRAMSIESATKMKELMSATIHSGTAHKSFRGILRSRALADLDMGGKTGSIVGDNPKGKCDWFVGYAQKDGRTLAISALTVNKEKWTVKAAYVASEIIQKYFTPAKTILTEKRHASRRRVASSSR